MWICKVCGYNLNFDHDDLCEDCGRDKEGKLGKKKKRKWWERKAPMVVKPVYDPDAGNGDLAIIAKDNCSMGKVKEAEEYWKAVESYYGSAIFIKRECKHGEIKELGGRLTGGKKVPKDLDLLVLLDDMYIDDVEMFDTGGGISSIKYRLIFFSILDRDVPRSERVPMLNKLLEVMYEYLRTGHKVHVQCIGGHGRTGLVMALLMGRYGGITEPIKWVKENYCKSAVESNKQVRFVSKMLKIPVEESYLVSYKEVKENECYQHGLEDAN